MQVFRAAGTVTSSPGCAPCQHLFPFCRLQTSISAPFYLLSGSFNCLLTRERQKRLSVYGDTQLQADYYNLTITFRWIRPCDLIKIPGLYMEQSLKHPVDALSQCTFHFFFIFSFKKVPLTVSYKGTDKPRML